MTLVAAAWMIGSACSTQGRSEGTRSPAHVPSAAADHKTTASSDRTWALELPQGWLSQDDGQVVSMFRQDGVGALQISSYFRDAPVTDEDLQELAAERLNAAAVPDPASVRLGAFTGLQVEFVDGDEFWSRWYVRHGHQALFITYNCAVAQRGPEFDDVKRILQTLEAAS
jgi:hypothetical protein